MVKQIVNDIKSSQFLSRILDGHNVIMAFVYGSRLIDITDDKSDYDILVITDNNERPSHPQEQLTYDGIKVEWCYKPIESIIDSRREPRDHFASMQLAFLTEDAIIYENPVYADVIQLLKQRKDTIGHINAFILYEVMQERVYSILEEGTITKRNYTKMLYHLCYASYYLHGEAPNKEFLNAIKRIYEAPVKEEFINLAVARLAMLRVFVSNSNFDTDAAVATLDSEVQMLLQNN